MHRPDDVEAILRRAAQIEAQRQDPAATLTDADLVEAAKAAGLSEEAVRQAIAEQRLAPVRGAADGDALRWTVTRRLPRLTDGQRAEMFSTVRRAAPYSTYITATPVETFGAAQQWTAEVAMMGTWARLRTDTDGDGDTWTMEHFATLDVAGLVWMMGAAGAALGAMLGALAAASLGVPLVGAVLAVLVTVAAVFSTPSVRRGILRRRRRQFDALVADLDRLSAPAPGHDAAVEGREAPLAAPAPLLTLDEATPAPDASSARDARVRG